MCALGHAVRFIKVFGKFASVHHHNGFSRIRKLRLLTLRFPAVVKEVNEDIAVALQEEQIDFFLNMFLCFLSSPIADDVWLTSSFFMTNMKMTIPE